MSDCPFDTRLARTPYLVIPKLALQAMPMEWRLKFETLLTEMEAEGICTPEYYVFRKAPHGKPASIKSIRHVNKDDVQARPHYVFTGGSDDPWANYRYGDALELSK